MIRRAALILLLLAAVLLDAAPLAHSRVRDAPPPAATSAKAASGDGVSPDVPAGPRIPPAMCDAAIAAAEAAHRLPARVLAAIGLRESGRLDPASGRVRPWPWTINYEGTGRYFDTKEAAAAAVREIQAAGGQSIDVGCMQVNLMHHPSAFASLDDAFDPNTNAAYSGRFLKSLFAQSGNWGSAISAYHSRTPGMSETYRQQVIATWRPTDPAVLARLRPPMPLIPFEFADSGSPGLARSGALPMVHGPLGYSPFGGPLSVSAQIKIGRSTAGRRMARSGSAYRSFMPPAIAYAAFAPRPRKQPGRPFVLRINDAGQSWQLGLIVPRGVIEPAARASRR